MVNADCGVIISSILCLWLICDRELKVGGPSYETRSQIGGSMK